MCSFLMHLFIHPELRSALSIMKYLKYSKEAKKSPFRLINFKNASMKLISAVYTEVILILMMSHVNDISDLIKDFVALGFIVEIDDQFAQNMSSINGELLIEECKEKVIIEVCEKYNSNLLSYIKKVLNCKLKPSKTK